MTKKEILNLINLYKSCTSNVTISKIEDYKFPRIEALGNELQVLLDEKNNRKNTFEMQTKELVELKQNCDHTVRLTYPGTFWTNRVCVMCGSTISTASNNTIYNDINRNSYFCEFPGSYDDEDYGYQEGVDIEVIYNYINEILKDKSDDDVIDLVQEMKKVYPKRCTYTEKPFAKEYYVLVVGGSNKIKVGDNHVITGLNSNISVDLTHFFLGIPKVKVELIETPEVYFTHKFKELFPYGNVDYGGKFESYETESELMQKLTNLSGYCPFDLVVDMSNIFGLSIQDEQLSIVSKKTDLKTLFPNSKIVRFEDISSINQYNKPFNEFQKDLLLLLKQQLLENNDMAIGYDSKNNDTYYKKDNSDETYQVVKSLGKVGETIKTLALRK